MATIASELSLPFPIRSFGMLTKEKQASEITTVGYTTNKNQLTARHGQRATVNFVRILQQRGQSVSQ